MSECTTRQKRATSFASRELLRLKLPAMGNQHSNSDIREEPYRAGPEGHSEASDTDNSDSSNSSSSSSAQANGVQAKKNKKKKKKKKQSSFDKFLAKRYHRTNRLLHLESNQRKQEQANARPKEVVAAHGQQLFSSAYADAPLRGE